MVIPQKNTAIRPERRAASAAMNERYAIASIIVTSEGAAALSIRRFVRTADASPNTTPKNTDPSPMATKLESAEKTWALDTWKWVASEGSASNVWKSTIATASLSTDSPKTSAYSCASTFNDPRTARVATGSVAESNAPKSSASLGEAESMPVMCPLDAKPNSDMPVINAATTVPTTARRTIAEKFLKKSLWFSENPDSKRIDGTR
mmetsp:Transcript_65000/g.155064  ORF Transcript_65000/g.155064 Transcript_65000/m.155064 type:complete len:206 (-) Transcript_65000:342-959(-)